MKNAERKTVHENGERTNGESQRRSIGQAGARTPRLSIETGGRTMNVRGVSLFRSDDRRLLVLEIIKSRK